MSILSRLSQDLSNAVQDAYGSVFLGDDAGKSAKTSLVLRPRSNSNSSKLDLGMTFIEINGRAYVRTVSPNSEAAKQGILPRDAVQFALVYKKEWMEPNNDLTDPDQTARSHAIECEQRGMRISYEELRTMLAEGMDPLQSAFTSPDPVAPKWTAPPIPTTINVCVDVGDEFPRPTSPYQLETPRPIVFVVRRTRQRPSRALLNFRLDDECDFAASLIRRLAPTSDMEMPSPDTWEELVHDGTDWLLGTGSMLPPKHSTKGSKSSYKKDEGSIPLDDYEQQRSIKLASLKSRMITENLHAHDRAEDVEASTIRGMIQKAVGLAFVRATKVVLGISLHGGSGIVISRLEDGTWSAPSAIGTWGLGLGIQFGLEVAEYIFILQTQESLDHFRKGGSFTIGGNIGAAVAGMGREAYGAASVSSLCYSPLQGEQQMQEDEYNDDDSRNDKRHSSIGIAPIVAYAKSQGLYVGVSLEGSRIFTRDDINARAYKFATGREVRASDILSGKVATPPEAEDLYASLHSVEFTHEMNCLPRPPECLRKDSPNSWFFDRSSLAALNRNTDIPSMDPFSFLENLVKEDAEEAGLFELQFKKFMYGGVSVQRLIPNSESRSGKTRKERRTLWLMLPEVGALRLGFVSKLSDGDAPVSNKSSTREARRDTRDYNSVSMDNDLGTVASEEVTLDSMLVEKERSMGGIRTGNVQLSIKHSIALTDVTVLSQEPHVPVRFSQEDQTEHLRVISIQDAAGTSLLFLANNFREAELLVCGLKLLLERETARLGVRGGLPITALGGADVKSGMSPAAARGFKEHHKENTVSSRRIPSGYNSSEQDDETATNFTADSSGMNQGRHAVPEGRKSWGNVPGRDYMRGQASQNDSHDEGRSFHVQGMPKYVHGQLLVRDIAANIVLPLPLPLCRVLLLDSTSPVIVKWERDRGDTNFSKTPWTFPPATNRENERHSSEHQLIASGSMLGAHRTTSFDRTRNGNVVRLSEVHIIDADDSEKLAFTVSERMPRRGFAIKIRILLKTNKDNSCVATILGEIRAVGKNMTNQAAVHKAFTLVLNEINARYGIQGNGLMSGFLTVVNGFPNSGMRAISMPSRSKPSSLHSPFPRTEPSKSNNLSPNRKKSGLVSLEDVMREKQMEPFRVLNSKPSPQPSRIPISNDFDAPGDEMSLEDSGVTIEVKPLPKIRLSLMPAPREEDEEDVSSSSQAAKPPVTKAKRNTSSTSFKRSKSSGRSKSKGSYKQ